MRRLMQVIGDSSFKSLFLSCRLAGTGQNCGLGPKNRLVSIRVSFGFGQEKGAVPASLLSLFSDQKS